MRFIFEMESAADTLVMTVINFSLQQRPFCDLKSKLNSLGLL